MIIEKKFWFLSACVAFFLAGCGGFKVVPVHGKVTVAGQPVSAGIISFIPKKGKQAIGAITENGTYKLTTYKEGDGAIVGSHVVTIHATKVEGAKVEAKSFEEEIELAKKADAGGKVFRGGYITWLAPERFSQQETTDLRAEVKTGDNEINFDLPQK